MGGVGSGADVTSGRANRLVRVPFRAGVATVLLCREASACSNAKRDAATPLLCLAGTSATAAGVSVLCLPFGTASTIVVLSVVRVAGAVVAKLGPPVVDAGWPAPALRAGAST